MFIAAGAKNPTCLGCLGDSLTGWTDAIGPGYFKGWCQRLQELTPNRVITNFGVGGYTTSSILTTWTSRVRSCGYKQITVLGGINDLVGGTTSTTIISNLETIFDQAIADGIKIFAMKLLPFGNHAQWNSTRQGYLETVNAFFVTKAAANSSLMTVVDTYTLVGASGDATKLHASYDNGDGLHLNSSGHQVVYDALKEMVLR